MTCKPAVRYNRKYFPTRPILRKEKSVLQYSQNRVQIEANESDSPGSFLLVEEV